MNGLNNIEMLKMIEHVLTYRPVILLNRCQPQLFSSSGRKSKRKASALEKISIFKLCDEVVLPDIKRKKWNHHNDQHLIPVENSGTEIKNVENAFWSDDTSLSSDFDEGTTLDHPVTESNESLREEIVLVESYRRVFKNQRSCRANVFETENCDSNESNIYQTEDISSSPAQDAIIINDDFDEDCMRAAFDSRTVEDESFSDSSEDIRIIEHHSHSKTDNVADTNPNETVHSVSDYLVDKAFKSASTVIVIEDDSKVEAAGTVESRSNSYPNVGEKCKSDLRNRLTSSYFASSFQNIKNVKNSCISVKYNIAEDYRFLDDAYSTNVAATCTPTHNNDPMRNASSVSSSDILLIEDNSKTMDLDNIKPSLSSSDVNVADVNVAGKKITTIGSQLESTDSPHPPQNIKTDKSHYEPVKAEVVDHRVSVTKIAHSINNCSCVGPMIMDVANMTGTSLSRVINGDSRFSKSVDMVSSLSTHSRFLKKKRKKGKKLFAPSSVVVSSENKTNCSVVSSEVLAGKMVNWKHRTFRNNITSSEDRENSSKEHNSIPHYTGNKQVGISKTCTSQESLLVKSVCQNATADENIDEVIHIPPGFATFPEKSQIQSTPVSSPKPSYFETSSLKKCSPVDGPLCQNINEGISSRITFSEPPEGSEIRPETPITSSESSIERLSSSNSLSSSISITPLSSLSSSSPSPPPCSTSFSLSQAERRSQSVSIKISFSKSYIDKKITLSEETCQCPVVATSSELPTLEDSRMSDNNNIQPSEQTAVSANDQVSLKISSDLRSPLTRKKASTEKQSINDPSLANNSATVNNTKTDDDGTRSCKNSGLSLGDELLSLDERMYLKQKSKTIDRKFKKSVKSVVVNRKKTTKVAMSQEISKQSCSSVKEGLLTKTQLSKKSGTLLPILPIILDNDLLAVDDRKPVNLICKNDDDKLKINTRSCTSVEEVTNTKRLLPKEFCSLLPSVSIDDSPAMSNRKSVAHVYKKDEASSDEAHELPVNFKSQSKELYQPCDNVLSAVEGSTKNTLPKDLSSSGNRVSDLPRDSTNALANDVFNVDNLREMENVVNKIQKYVEQYEYSSPTVQRKVQQKPESSKTEVLEVKRVWLKPQNELKKVPIFFMDRGVRVPIISFFLYRALDFEKSQLFGFPHLNAHGYSTSLITSVCRRHFTEENLSRINVIAKILFKFQQVLIVRYKVLNRINESTLKTAEKEEFTFQIDTVCRKLLALDLEILKNHLNTLMMSFDITDYNFAFQLLLLRIAEVFINFVRLKINEMLHFIITLLKKASECAGFTDIRFIHMLGLQSIRETTRNLWQLITTEENIVLANLVVPMCQHSLIKHSYNGP